MSRHKPGFEDRVRAFAVRLSDHRALESMTQDEMSIFLGISRKTYILMEQGRWLPGDRQGHQMIHQLHKLDPALAVEFAKLHDTTVESFGIAPPAPAPAARRLEAQHAKSAYDAAVYDAAEQAEMPAKLLRPVIAAVLASLQEAGMPMEQAVEIAKGAARAKPARRGDVAEGASTRYRAGAAGDVAASDGGEGGEGETAGHEGVSRRKR